MTAAATRRRGAEHEPVRRIALDENAPKPTTTKGTLLSDFVRWRLPGEFVNRVTFFDERPDGFALVGDDEDDE